MTPIITGIIAVAFYLSGAILQYFSLKGRHKSYRNQVLLLGLLALACHAVSFNGTLYNDRMLDLSFYKIASLIGWLMALLATLSSIKKPLQNLFMGIYPIAAVALSIELLLLSSDHSMKLVQQWSPQMASHILLSIFAYSILAIAAMQATLLAVQDYHLRHHQTSNLIMGLPPLQTMDQLLFELTWVGVVLLTVSILSGMLFIEDMFAQHLVHKTILSIIAWAIFSALLAGRHLLGWRGTTAIRWTISGYILLMLAVFGSKLVLEIVLI